MPSMAATLASMSPAWGFILATLVTWPTVLAVVENFERAISMLDVIADVEDLRLADGKPNKQGLAVATGTSPTTVRKIYKREGEPPQGPTLEKIEVTHAAALLKRAGYAEQSPARKRERMIGALQAMSDGAADALYEVVMKHLQADMAMEFSAPGADALAAQADEAAASLATQQGGPTAGRIPPAAGQAG